MEEFDRVLEPRGESDRLKGLIEDTARWLRFSGLIPCKMPCC